MHLKITQRKFYQQKAIDDKERYEADKASQSLENNDIGYGSNPQKSSSELSLPLARIKKSMKMSSSK